jgi:UDP-N-acetylglucosamine:LPS N-acetylglucosamine transferase
MDAVIDSMMDFSEWRIEIICGGNISAYEHLRDKYHPFRHITVRDSVQNMADFYVASDVIATNPNGVRIAEAAAMGAAILLLDPLPGLERLNCDYALERGAARRVFDSRRTGERISELLDSDGALSLLRSNAKAMSRPEAGRRIILHVMDRLDAAEHQAAQSRHEEAAGAGSELNGPDEPNNPKPDAPAQGPADNEQKAAMGGAAREMDAALDGGR